MLPGSQRMNAATPWSASGVSPQTSVPGPEAKRSWRTLVEKIQPYFGEALNRKPIAVWGLAFKAKTDDIREAPALVLIEELLRNGVRVVVHDPEAMDNVRAQYGDRLQYASTPLEALKDADALAINTEWDEFRSPDLQGMKRLMKAPIVFDGRNLYNPDDLHEAGFAYFSIGRQPVSSAG